MNRTLGQDNCAFLTLMHSATGIKRSQKRPERSAGKVDQPINIEWQAGFGF